MNCTNRNFVLRSRQFVTPEDRFYSETETIKQWHSKICVSNRKITNFTLKSLLWFDELEALKIKIVNLTIYIFLCYETKSCLKFLSKTVFGGEHHQTNLIWFDTMYMGYSIQYLRPNFFFSYKIFFLRFSSRKYSISIFFIFREIFSFNSPFVKKYLFSIA